MLFAGIDYSMTSPSITIYDEKKELEFENCEVYFLSTIKKVLGTFGNITGAEMIRSENVQFRFNFISDWAIDLLNTKGVGHVFLEGYAFGATGRVFQIAENTGLLKHKLFENEFTFSIYAPSEIKKFATRKGNASKELLNETFKEQEGLDLKDLLNLTDKQWNPSSDIIDSYYICKFGVYNASRN